jgi:peptidoglycan/xylan/chitin deacetylase (PgdA/CDA1 family)
VLEDERLGFEAHLKFLKKLGDFLSLDDAATALQNPKGVGGRYFCITFDDGLKNCIQHAVPILVQNQCPAAFFVVTNYVGLDPILEFEKVKGFPSPYPLPFEFLNWDDCREIVRAGMTIGSHTLNHLRLSKMNDSEAEWEMAQSKWIIERELGRPCDHFACPWGGSDTDFNPGVHPKLARKVGYKTFLTTVSGYNFAGTNPYTIRRTYFLGCQGTTFLRKALSRSRPG